MLFCVQSPHFGPDAKFPVMKEIITTVVTSQVSYHAHSEVTQLYFETLVRYEKYFTHEPQHLPMALASFLDERGLHHPSSHVRSRCAYFFTRFVKLLRFILILMCWSQLAKPVNAMLIQCTSPSCCL
jgi:hypothetical protein